MPDTVPSSKLARAARQLQACSRWGHFVCRPSSAWCSWHPAWKLPWSQAAGSPADRAQARISAASPGAGEEEGTDSEAGEAGEQAAATQDVDGVEGSEEDQEDEENTNADRHAEAGVSLAGLIRRMTRAAGNRQYAGAQRRLVALRFVAGGCMPARLWLPACMWLLLCLGCMASAAQRVPAHCQLPRTCCELQLRGKVCHRYRCLGHETRLAQDASPATQLSIPVGTRGCCTGCMQLQRHVHTVEHPLGAHRQGPNKNLCPTVPKPKHNPRLAHACAALVTRLGQERVAPHLSWLLQPLAKAVDPASIDPPEVRLVCGGAAYLHLHSNSAQRLPG